MSTDLAIRINEAHALAMQHAGKAVGFAIACGELLLEAKAKVPHGQWLPWLRENVAFGERSAQGYMRIAQRLPNAQRVADLPLRRVLDELRTPLRSWREAYDADLRAWLDNPEYHFRRDPNNWKDDDLRRLGAGIRAFYEILHRYDVCPCADDPEIGCPVHDDEEVRREQKEEQEVATTE